MSQRAMHKEPVTGKPLDIFGVAAGVFGLVATASALPVAVRSLCLAVFLFAGPGLAIVCWLTNLPNYAKAILTPLAGLALVLIINTALVDLKWWSPTTTTVVLALVVILACVAAMLRGSRQSPTPVDIV
jgi:hypothetical protein